MDDSGKNEKAEEALTRGPEVCHLRRLSKPYHRSCVIPFTTQLYPLYKDYKEMIIKVANPFAMMTQRLHRRGVSVCACAGSLRTGTVRAALSLVQGKPVSCALRRAAVRTSVSPELTQDHHEDPEDQAGRHDDQDAG